MSSRKTIAQETLKIQQQGYYTINGVQINFDEKQKASEKDSFLITPEKGMQLVQAFKPPLTGSMASISVVNQSVIQAILNMQNDNPTVLNFASAKNPGGGFLGGAMAQEEALAASSGLYNTLLLHKDYYDLNRACGTMMYTNHAIYSPQVVFFRDAKFTLLEYPVTASVLTLPAVNMGQVILKGEDIQEAKHVMKERMRLCLTIFAHTNNKHLILGAYGCGVFRNNPHDVAQWWKELLLEEGYARFFTQIVFAVMDTSKTQANISAFESLKDV